VKKKKNQYTLNLFLPIILVVIFLLILIFERIYTNSNFKKTTNNINLNMLNNIEWDNYFKNKNTDYKEKSLIIYDRNNDFSNTVKNNIKYVLSTMSVKTYIKDINEINDYDDLSIYDTIIVCIQNLDQLNYSVFKLSDYVYSGGGLLFALNIVLSNNLNIYYNLLGIENLKSTEEVSKFVFNDNILINSKGKIFDDLINSNILNFELIDNANVHASSNDLNMVPLIWDFQYGEGYVGVSNNSLLSFKTGRGLIASIYSAIHDVFVYPVINSATYFLDDFPSPIPNGYEDLVFNEYGYSIKDFYSNVWWPAMYEISKNKGVKFSAYLIQTYEDDVDGPFNNTYFIEESQYYINKLLSIGGEIGIHGYNHQPLVVGNYDYGENTVYKQWPSTNLALESIKSVLEYTKKLANGSEVISYVPPSNILSEELFLKMQEEVPEIKIYSSLYIGDNSTFDQEFEVLENGVVNVPRLYSNMEISDNSLYLMLNELSYHYVFSHFIHPDDILDIDRRSEKGFSYMLKKYTEMINFINSTKIRNTSISEAAAAIERYQITSVNQTYKKNILKLQISGIYDEVYYFLKTNGKRIKNVKGCIHEEIAENYFVLTISDSLVEIELE